MLLSVRLIYVAGLPRCYYLHNGHTGNQTWPLVGRLHLITETLWLFANHTSTADFSQLKNHLYLSLAFPVCPTWVVRRCTLWFYLLSRIVVWIGGDFVRGPTDYRCWLVVECNPFSPSLSKTPLGYARLPEGRQRGRWIPPPRAPHRLASYSAPPQTPDPHSHSTPKTLLMSWDGGCKVSRIWNHRHLCLIALSPLSENCPQAWFPFCSYILAWLECLPSPLAQRKRNKLQTIWSHRLDETRLDLIKPHFVNRERILICCRYRIVDMENRCPRSVSAGLE